MYWVKGPHRSKNMSKTWAVHWTQPSLPPGNFLSLLSLLLSLSLVPLTYDVRSFKLRLQEKTPEAVSFLLLFMERERKKRDQRERDAKLFRCTIDFSARNKRWSGIQSLDQQSFLRSLFPLFCCCFSWFRDPSLLQMSSWDNHATSFITTIKCVRESVGESRAMERVNEKEEEEDGGENTNEYKRGRKRWLIVSVKGKEERATGHPVSTTVPSLVSMTHLIITRISLPSFFILLRPVSCVCECDCRLSLLSFFFIVWMTFKASFSSNAKRKRCRRQRWRRERQSNSIQEMMMMSRLYILRTTND